MSDLRTAEKCFKENVQFLGPQGPTRDPEKFNLYQGLANLARGMQSIESELTRLREGISRLAR